MDETTIDQVGEQVDSMPDLCALTDWCEVATLQRMIEECEMLKTFATADPVVAEKLKQVANEINDVARSNVFDPVVFATALATMRAQLESVADARPVSPFLECFEHLERICQRVAEETNMIQRILCHKRRPELAKKLTTLVQLAISRSFKVGRISGLAEARLQNHALKTELSQFKLVKTTAVIERKSKAIQRKRDARKELERRLKEVPEMKKTSAINAMAKIGTWGSKRQLIEDCKGIHR